MISSLSLNPATMADLGQRQTMYSNVKCPKVLLGKYPQLMTGVRVLTLTNNLTTSLIRSSRNRRKVLCAFYECQKREELMIMRRRRNGSEVHLAGVTNDDEDFQE